MDSEINELSEDWPDWPLCPRCGQRRSARCPACGASRNDFRPADVHDSIGEPAPPLLRCEDCDDVMHPEWYRFCAACGHDFGDGLDVGEATAEKQAASGILSVIAIALLAAAFMLAAYFAWLFGGRVV